MVLRGQVHQRLLSLLFQLPANVFYFGLEDKIVSIFAVKFSQSILFGFVISLCFLVLCLFCLLFCSISFSVSKFKARLGFGPFNQLFVAHEMNFLHLLKTNIYKHTVRVSINVKWLYLVSLCKLGYKGLDCELS